MIFNLFHIFPSETIKPKEKGIILRLYGRAIVDFFISKNLYSGDKVKNQIMVPRWIKNNACTFFLA